MAGFDAQRSTFRRLHESGCFVIPNPWDVGSARYLKSLGFEALATTSAGFGFSHGLPDSPFALEREAVLHHVAEIVNATDLPVNADFQSGYGTTPEQVAESVRLCVEAGVSGLSIEDATGDPDEPLYELPAALERLRAARKAIDATGHDVMLTARAECFLVGMPDPLPDAIRRIEAYANEGADVLFAPAPARRETITAIVKAAKGKPVNVIVSNDTGLTVEDIGDLGARRISVGSALARAAWTGFMKAVLPIRSTGSFEGLKGLATFAELNDLFRTR
jgi:2-methylisocitrate lyase-like PEP mutase family enzyme